MASFPERAFFDDPAGVSPVLARLLITWGETLCCARFQFPPHLARALPGTRSAPEAEARRSWLAADWYCRECAPAWLRLAGLGREAAVLQACEPILAPAAAGAAVPALESAGRTACFLHDEAAREAGQIARTVARVAAAMGVHDARPFAEPGRAREAAIGAAADAAGSAAGDAALVAVLCAAGVPRREAARAFSAGAFADAGRGRPDRLRAAPAAAAALVAATGLTRAAMMAAALAATRRAPWPATFVSRAWRRLEPTVRRLQGSALRLIEEMTSLH